MIDTKPSDEIGVSKDIQKLETNDMIQNNDPILKQEIKKEPEKKQPIKEVVEPQKPEIKDISDEKKEATQSNPFVEIEPEKQEEPIKQEEPHEKPITNEEASMSAQMLIGTFNFVAPQIFAPLVEVDTLQLANILVDAQIDPTKPVEVFEKSNNEIRQVIQLSKQEIESIEPFLVEVIKESNIRPTAKQALFTSVAFLAITKYNAVRMISNRQQQEFNEIKRMIGNMNLQKPRRNRLFGGLRNKLKLFKFVFSKKAVE